MKKILTIACALTFIAGSAFAYTLDDSNGGGPGAAGVATSANGLVDYSAAAGAGGYGGPAGMIMSSVSASSKANPADALFFAVRSSMDPGDVDDNSVYQLAADGTQPVIGTVTGYLTADFGAGDPWFKRGGS